MSLMATLVALTTSTSAFSFADDSIWSMFEMGKVGVSEDAESAEQMKQSLISAFNLKPIHIDEEATQSLSDENKLEKKQRHGRTVEYDIGGLGWDYALS